MSLRIGFGFDSHAFKPGVPLVIGGLKIDHPEGLAGHSDGDVLLHAITDALFGAVSAGDIGTFFPLPTPLEGRRLLHLPLHRPRRDRRRRVPHRQHRHSSDPRRAEDRPHRRRTPRTRCRSARRQARRGRHQGQDPEGLNQDHVAVAYATVLLESATSPEQLTRMTAAAESPEEISEVVKSLIGDSRSTAALGRKVPAFDTDDLT